MGRTSKRRTILDEVKKIPGTRPVPKFEHGYFWEVAGGRFRFSLVVLPDLDHVIQMNTRETHDEQLILATLTTALDHHREIVNGNSCNVIHNFHSPPYGFDQVVSLAPHIHPVNQVDYPALHEATFAVFPAFRCEFTGTEYEEELQLLYSKLVTPADVTRPPKPIVRIRFKNSRTGARSVGRKLGLTTFDSLTTQLENLANSPDSFVECENFQKTRASVEWDEGYIWKDETGTYTLSSTEVLERAKAMIFLGQSQTGSVPMGAGTREVQDAGCPKGSPMTLVLENGFRANPATIKDIRSAVKCLGQPGNCFVILEATPMTYMQAEKCDEGLFLVEYQDGGLDKHFEACRLFDKQELIAMLGSYLAGTDFWRRNVTWEKIDVRE